MWGSHLMYGPIEITCLVVGLSSILASRYLPDEIRRDRTELRNEEAPEVERRGDSSAEGQDQQPDYDSQQE
jgi:hypothetical protein